MSLQETNNKAAKLRPIYFLADHAYCCEFEDGAIILELRTGTYMGVHARYLPVIKSRVRNWPDSLHTGDRATSSADTDSDAVFAGLLKRGILSKSPAPARNAVAPPPHASLTIPAVMCVDRFAPLPFIGQFLHAFFKTILWHGDRRMISLLDWIQRKQHSINRKGLAPDPHRLLLTVMYFCRLRLWFYTSDQHCLFDSLALAVYLTRQAIACTFLIGVSTKPFTAHAWVQVGDLVLNDTAEHVQTFTPILVVGAPA